MTSTNMFSGLDNGAKPSSRVLRPPGGGSSDLFGGYEEEAAASRRPHKMASNLFAPPEPQGVIRRTNPPDAPAEQRRPVPSGGNTSNIFGGLERAPPSVKAHSNKPKDNISVGESPMPIPEPPAPLPKEILAKEVKEENVASPPPTPTKVAVEPASAPSAKKPEPEASLSELSLKDHEPHLGPRPRSHNKVLNPPGGKSSVVFY
ncbi:jupiter microtubule associated homolog 2 isoform X2 [Salvelinus sp. IW2-2015]|uniref:jupiter microtubule associated homolog 2 isoform X2 n=1 Tax=Salvelinus sp. IW2-2015 TaxID=2691554 RepID=UPI000CDF878E|nr:jupiter microtubule associated homolog 2 isoform X2 [Salvelinus alpinus]